MKKHISAVLVLALALTALFAGFGGAAKADGVTFTVTPSVSELLKGDDVTFSYTIVNNNADEIPDASIIYNGGAVESIGNIPAGGQTESGEFTLNVSDDMLGQTLTFTLQSGEATSATATAKVDKKIPSVKLAASASASTDMADSGDTVKFTFKLQNQGEADITNIVVKASGLNGGKALKDAFSLAAGSDPYSFTFSVKMTSDGDLEVKPTISYTANGEAQDPITLDTMKVTLSKRDVHVNLSVDNDHPQAGEEVTFTLNLVNNGNVSYSHMKVYMNGEEVDFSTSHLKPDDDLKQDYKYSFDTATDVTFSITMDDQNGETKSVSSNTVSIELPVDTSIVNDKLKLVMNVDRPQLTSAGTINFSGYVSNATEYELLNVEVNEAALGNIYNTSSLEAGGKATIDLPADINETTTYNFVLTATDKDGNSYTINAEPITVTVQSAAPTPTNFEDAADVTESGQVLDNSSGSFDWSKFFLILAIVLIVAIIGVAVALIVLWKKGRTPGGRPGSRSSGKPVSRSVASSSAARKKPSGSYGGRGPRKPTNNRGYHDRNNF